MRVNTKGSHLVQKDEFQEQMEIGNKTPLKGLEIGNLQVQIHIGIVEMERNTTYTRQNLRFKKG